MLRWELCFSTDSVVFIGDGPCCGAMLNLRSGQPAAPTAGPVTAAPVSRGFLQPPGQMQEKEVHTKHVKVRLIGKREAQYTAHLLPKVCYSV